MTHFCHAQSTECISYASYSVEVGARQKQSQPLSRANASVFFRCKQNAGSAAYTPAQQRSAVIQGASQLQRIEERLSGVWHGWTPHHALLAGTMSSILSVAPDVVGYIVGIASRQPRLFRGLRGTFLVQYVALRVVTRCFSICQDFSSKRKKVE